MHTVTQTVEAGAANPHASTKATSMSTSMSIPMSKSPSTSASTFTYTSASTAAPAATTSATAKTCNASQFWCSNFPLIVVLFAFMILVAGILGAVGYFLYLKYKNRPKKKNKGNKSYPESSFSGDRDDRFGTGEYNDRGLESGMPGAMGGHGAGGYAPSDYGGGGGGMDYDDDMEDDDY